MELNNKLLKHCELFIEQGGLIVHVTNGADCRLFLFLCDSFEILAVRTDGYVICNCHLSISHLFAECICIQKASNLCFRDIQNDQIYNVLLLLSMFRNQFFCLLFCHFSFEIFYYIVYIVVHDFVFLLDFKRLK